MQKKESWIAIGVTRLDEYMEAVSSGRQVLSLDTLRQHMPQDLLPGLLRPNGQKWLEQLKTTPRCQALVLQCPQLDIHLHDPDRIPTNVCLTELEEEVWYKEN